MSQSSEDFDLYKVLLFLNSEGEESEKKMYAMLNQAIIKKKGVASVSVIKKLARATGKTQKPHTDTRCQSRFNGGVVVAEKEVNTSRNSSWKTDNDRSELPDITIEDLSEEEQFEIDAPKLNDFSLWKRNAPNDPISPTKLRRMADEHLGSFSRTEVQTKISEKLKLLFDCESN
uniref:Spike protein P3 n=1 Tax=Lygus hesperus TaxID=30085 RepID=A0A0A9Z5A7_LYGHE